MGGDLHEVHELSDRIDPGSCRRRADNRYACTLGGSGFPKDRKGIQSTAYIRASRAELISVGISDRRSELKAEAFQVMRCQVSIVEDSSHQSFVRALLSRDALAFRRKILVCFKRCRLAGSRPWR